MGLFFLCMVSIVLCSSLPTENCFKAEPELELLVIDEHTNFQSQIESELGAPLPKNIRILNYIAVCGRHDPDIPLYWSFVVCES